MHERVCDRVRTSATRPGLSTAILTRRHSRRKLNGVATTAAWGRPAVQTTQRPTPRRSRRSLRLGWRSVSCWPLSSFVFSARPHPREAAISTWTPVVGVTTPRRASDGYTATRRCPLVSVSECTTGVQVVWLASRHPTHVPQLARSGCLQRRQHISSRDPSWPLACRMSCTLTPRTAGRMSMASVASLPRLAWIA
jgi:hypothetical protein